MKANPRIQAYEERPDVAVVAAPDAACLDAFLRPPRRIVVEGTGRDDPATRRMAAVRDGGLLLSVTSATAFAVPLAKAFCAWVARWHAIPADRLIDMETALHEAVSNALLHGNLEISSTDLEAIEDADAYAAALKAPLADPRLAARRIDLEADPADDGLTVYVTDEGAGYAPNAGVPGGPHLEWSGRGLGIMRAHAHRVRLLDGGRTTALTFDLTAVADGPAAGAEAMSAADVDLGPYLEESRVLVVDDDEINRLIVQDWLNGIGIGQVDQAADGLECLEQIARARPSLILLDLAMPRFDGFQVLEHLSAMPDARTIPVFVLTAWDDREARNRALRLGATNLISKPLSPEVVTARVLEVLERRRLLDVLKGYQERVGQELEQARDMQRDLVPDDGQILTLEQRYGCCLDAVFRPSSELGGDTWGAMPLGTDKLALFLADFSGHGVSAAINVFRLQAAMEDLKSLAPEPAAFLEALNGRLCRLLPVGQFATLVHAVVDFAADSLTYASAAASGILVSHGADGAIDLADGEGLLLGVRSEARYVERRLAFPPGSSLVLFSDALYETPVTGGGNLDLEGVRDLARRDDVRHARRPLARLLAVFEAAATNPPSDDLTAVWLRRR